MESPIRSTFYCFSLIGPCYNFTKFGEELKKTAQLVFFSSLVLLLSSFIMFDASFSI